MEGQQCKVGTGFYINLEGMYRVILNYCRRFHGLYFQTGNNKIKPLREYENVTQNVSFYSGKTF
jgi:hypothetical protein